MPRQRPKISRLETSLYALLATINKVIAMKYTRRPWNKAADNGNAEHNNTALAMFCAICISRGVAVIIY